MAHADAVRARLAGRITPIVTPFDADGVLSEGGLAVTIDFLVAAGVNGIVPGDLVGEYPALSLAERQTLIEASVRFARGRCAVIALGNRTMLLGMCAISMQSALQAAQHWRISF